jgi:excisionase family DNA binding protein
METKENDFLSIKEFASKLGVHPNTVRRSIKSGRISAFKVGGGKRSIYRIARTEVQRMAILDMREMIKQFLKEEDYVKRSPSPTSNCP